MKKLQKEKAALERKQLDSVLLREGEQFITYLITDEKEKEHITKTCKS